MRKLRFQLVDWKRRSCRPGAPLEAKGGCSSCGRFVSLSSSGGPPCLRPSLPTLGIFCPWGLPPTQPTRALLWVRKPANLELPCSCPGGGGPQGGLQESGVSGHRHGAHTPVLSPVSSRRTGRSPLPSPFCPPSPRAAPALQASEEGSPGRLVS